MVLSVQDLNKAALDVHLQNKQNQKSMRLLFMADYS